jgi:universal stress protein E
MIPNIAIGVDRWYLRWDKGEVFQVTAQDAGTGQITIRAFDGGVEVLSAEDWSKLRVELADPPYDWAGRVTANDELPRGVSLPSGLSRCSPEAVASAASGLKQILVAVKGVAGNWSPAVAKATQIACATGAQIQLFHCVDASLSLNELANYKNGIEEFEAGQRKYWEEGLERLADHVRRHDVQVSCSAQVDYPIHEAIVRQAKRVHADLVVTDGYEGNSFAPSLLQPVDWDLVRLSAAPVLIVRRPQLYHRPIVLAAVDPKHRHSKPAALDGKILNFAGALSNALHGSLCAMHAYPVTAAYAEASAAASASVAAQLQAVDAAEAGSALDELLGESPVPAERRHIVAGSPAEAIVRTAGELGSALVVMGSVARSGVGRFLIGNTAEKILHRLPCDLLLIKPDNFECAVPDERRGARLIATGVYL